MIFPAGVKGQEVVLNGDTYVFDGIGWERKSSNALLDTAATSNTTWSSTKIVSEIQASATTVTNTLDSTKADKTHTHTKADVGLSNVDNTSDANKPISTATQIALDGKASAAHTHTAFTTLTVDVLRGKAVNNVGTVLDVSQADLFTVVLTSGVNTFSLTNVPTNGDVITFILEVQNVSGSSITWWSGIKWAGGSVPTPTTIGTDIYCFYSKDGVTWRGALAQKDSK